MGEVVISHDAPLKPELTFWEFLDLYRQYGDGLPLALNIKADGLAKNVKSALEKMSIKNYFVFDMSAPDHRYYINEKVNSFTRESDFETIPVFYRDSQGVWLDEFDSHWLSQEVFIKHLKNNKSIAIVSPELHGRSYQKEWLEYRECIRTLNESGNIYLCTDFPSIAKEFFE